ncbi:MAG: hypothetical protein COB67_05500 [SAR324 cluster bacterium]|uniref:Leucine-binding protein domain-containing protein n=1 Tax=SAR324 cluster bacterium TaxID=2024889 RepID=A0A2A4T6Q3_9DELT|nr:MAG: hypothetical protein COB67_05500 [SAR324 cluster bacterium]
MALRFRFPCLTVLSFFFLLQVLEACPIKIGLVADLTRRSGEGIKNGLLIGIEEMNRQGRTLGCKLQLEVRDDEGMPDRAIDFVQELAEDEQVSAVFGGLLTPVMMHVNKQLITPGIVQIPYFSVWAAGTPVVNTQWSYRLSLYDSSAGGFLVKQVVAANFKKVALLLLDGPWGWSNHRVITKALKKRGLVSLSIDPTNGDQQKDRQWMNPKSQWYPRNTDKALFYQKLSSFIEAGAEAILFVGNEPEGVNMAKAMAQLAKQGKGAPIFSHWGITGDRFPERVGKEDMKLVDIRFIQTQLFTPQRKSNPRVREVMSVAQSLFPSLQGMTLKQLTEYFDSRAPSGTIHAVDAIRILTIAIKQAGNLNRKNIRNALNHIRTPVEGGLVKPVYYRPFNPDLPLGRDALRGTRFLLASYYKAPGDPKAGWVIRPVH